MKTTLHGGPFDGLEIEFPETVDKLIVVDDRYRVHRYETDGSWSQITEAGGVIEGADMRLTDNPEEFDAELRGAMGARWGQST